MRIPYLLLLIILFLSCNNSKKKIDAIVNNIDGQIMLAANNTNNYRYVTLDTFVWGADTASTVVIYNEGSPIRVVYLSELNFNKEQDFFLDNRTSEVIYFLESGYNLENEIPFQHQIYYQDGKVIKAQSSSIGIHQEHETEGWQDYQSPDKNNDFRLHPDSVNTLVKQIIRETEANQPGLSPAANTARKKGFEIWGTAANGEWAVGIIEGHIIDFEYDYGKQKIQFEEFDLQNFDTETNRLQYVAKDGNEVYEFIFELSDCNNDDGFEYQFTVNLKFQDNIYTGCGVLF